MVLESGKERLTINLEPFTHIAGESYILNIGSRSINSTLWFNSTLNYSIKKADYLVYIEGSNRLQDYESSLYIQGIAKDINIKPSLQLLNFTYKWTCEDLNT